ncbi:MAG TPA: HlyD family secretion protein [Chlorobium sp.]|uniref:Putative ABC transport system, lipoprotein n=1 Tax=Chlorobium phaeovibrioides (strain DSM 265 / 1930) TaxID=290318 RepID=A4SEG5_CHLPM|nr:HlyD family secretion protein [Chlorobium sp.]
MKHFRKAFCSACILTSLLLFGCGGNGQPDGYGNFESTEIIVSSEASGKLLFFPVEEGEKLDKGAVAALVDTTQLHFSLQQLLAQQKGMKTKKPSLRAEASVYRQQRSNLEQDVLRYRRLVAEGAAPAKQLEDLENQVKVVERQIASVATRNPEVDQEVRSIEAQILRIRDQIKRSSVVNPSTGVVLAAYAEEGEVTAYGKPLYRIADLDSMYLRVYLSGSQLASVAIGDSVDVLVDGEKPAEHKLSGRVSWISSKAEFTPKIIQTREDRVTMVYAVKVLVKNPDGLLKIGMPGEIRFRKATEG